MLLNYVETVCLTTMKVHTRSQHQKAVASHNSNNIPDNISQAAMSVRHDGDSELLSIDGPVKRSLKGKRKYLTSEFEDEEGMMTS